MPWLRPPHPLKNIGIVLPIFCSQPTDLPLAGWGIFPTQRHRVQPARAPDPNKKEATTWQTKKVTCVASAVRSKQRRANVTDSVANRHHPATVVGWRTLIAPSTMPHTTSTARTTRTRARSTRPTRRRCRRLASSNKAAPLDNEWEIVRQLAQKGHALLCPSLTYHKALWSVRDE